MQKLLLSHHQRLIHVWEKPTSTREASQAESVDTKIDFRCSYFGNSKDLFHEWRPRNYSFVFMKISPTSLVSMCTIQKNFYAEMRLVGLIIIY